MFINSSSILTQTDEFDFLQSTNKDIILAKDFFVDGFTSPSLPQRNRGRPMNIIFESIPGNGSGGSSPAPSSGNSTGSCPATVTPKGTPEEITHHLGFRPKTKKEKALEKMKQELKESIKEQDKLNAERQKQSKKAITLIIKDGMRFFVPNDQLPDKFHHAPNLDSPIPGTLGEAELARLADPSLYKERLQTF